MVVNLATWVSAFLLVVGAAAMLIASIGLIRMPDLYLRMSGASKASTLGVGSLALAAALYFGDFGVAARAGAVFVFVLLTTPIAAHMMSRAAYGARTPMWDRTVVDEMGGRIVAQTGEEHRPRQMAPAHSIESPAR